MDVGEVVELARRALAGELLGVGPAVPLVVDLRDADGIDATPLGALPCVVVGIGHLTSPHTNAVDVIVADHDAAEVVVDAVVAHPIAATALALHLRASAHQSIPAALVAESATYSTLQAGPEHRRWLAEHTAPSAKSDDGSRVRIERDGDRLHVTLARVATRNAVDASMQAALVDAFALAEDPGVTAVVIDGDGPVFSSGGDLAEFGTLADPASAHLLRVVRSPGLALSRIATKTTVLVHGACHGAGVELPAFAHHVVARPGTTFTLPEVGMGLVPGAGGTVSLPRRIGRQRTAWLGITGRPIDAPTALAWGLVDELAS